MNGYNYGPLITDAAGEEVERQKRIRDALKTCFDILKVEVGGFYAEGGGKGRSVRYPGTERLEIPNDLEAIICMMDGEILTDDQIEDLVDEAAMQKAEDDKAEAICARYDERLDQEFWA